jgi:hypothetical protein
MAACGGTCAVRPSTRKGPPRQTPFHKEKLAAHHDALEFPDGGIVLLTLLQEGHAASALQLPAQPKTEADARVQERVGFVG